MAGADGRVRAREVDEGVVQRLSLVSEAADGGARECALRGVAENGSAFNLEGRAHARAGFELLE